MRLTWKAIGFLPAAIILLPLHAYAQEPTAQQQAAYQAISQSYQLFEAANEIEKKCKFLPPLVREGASSGSLARRRVLRERFGVSDGEFKKVEQDISSLVASHDCETLIASPLGMSAKQQAYEMADLILLTIALYSESVDVSICRQQYNRVQAKFKKAAGNIVAAILADPAKAPMVEEAKRASARFGDLCLIAGNKEDLALELSAPFSMMYALEFFLPKEFGEYGLRLAKNAD